MTRPRDRFGDELYPGETEPCTGLISSFDIAATASAYSTLAGVLAGFAFTALVLLVTRGVSGSAALASAPFLVTAFIALVLTAVGYSVLAGEPTSGARAASSQVVLGVVFAASGLLIFQAVGLLMRSDNGSASVMAASQRTLRVVGAVVLTPVMMLSLTGGTADLREIRPETEWLADIGYALTAGCACVVGLAWIFKNAASMKRSCRSDARLLPGLSLTVAAVGIGAVLSAFNDTCPHSGTPAGVAAGALGAGAVVLVTSALAFLHDPTESVSGDSPAWASR